MVGIYKITNKLNNKYYVGSSTNMKLRVYNHFRKLRHGIHENSHLQNAWNKYGETCFEFQVVETVEKCNLLKTEQLYLDVALKELQTCYNQNFIAGCGPGIKRGTKFSDSHIDNLRKSHMGQIAWNRGHTKESNISIKNMSISKTGRVRNDVAKTYTFIDPFSIVIQIHNLRQFCLKNDLVCSIMRDIHRGTRKCKIYKGYKKYV